MTRGRVRGFAPGRSLTRVPQEGPQTGLFDEHCEILGQTIRSFVENETVPHVDAREDEGCTQREFFSAELVSRVAYALQSHGGCGTANKFLTDRLCRDAREKSIAGGTTEILKEIVAKRLGM